MNGSPAFLDETLPALNKAISAPTEIARLARYTITIRSTFHVTNLPKIVTPNAAYHHAG